jgi:DNA-binding GntR family transcriptional regulator
LAGIILSYSERSERYVRFGQQAHADTFAVAEAEHEEILAALVAGEAETAGALMARHLAHTATTVLTDLDDCFNALTVAQSLRMCVGDSV